MWPQILNTDFSFFFYPFKVEAKFKKFLSTLSYIQGSAWSQTKFYSNYEWKNGLFSSSAQIAQHKSLVLKPLLFIANTEFPIKRELSFSSSSSRVTQDAACALRSISISIFNKWIGAEAGSSRGGKGWAGIKLYWDMGQIHRHLQVHPALQGTAEIFEEGPRGGDVPTEGSLSQDHARRTFSRGPEGRTQRWRGHWVTT